MLKWPDVTTILKNGQRSQEDNYRQVLSILPSISKQFSRPLLKQLSSFMTRFVRFINVAFEKVLIHNTAFMQ